jgi:prolyl oligopeptidase PreP (S9A serine peptidase family)
MTAVEWYSNKLIEILGDMCNEFTQEQTLANHYALKQANELFEQQIKDAYVYGFKECEKIHEKVFFIQDLSDDYYLQTYKKDNL